MKDPERKWSKWHITGDHLEVRKPFECVVTMDGRPPVKMAHVASLLEKVKVDADRARKGETPAKVRKTTLNSSRKSRSTSASTSRGTSRDRQGATAAGKGRDGSLDSVGGGGPRSRDRSKSTDAQERRRKAKAQKMSSPGKAVHNLSDGAQAGVSPLNRLPVEDPGSSVALAIDVGDVASEQSETDSVEQVWRPNVPPLTLGEGVTFCTSDELR